MTNCSYVIGAEIEDKGQNLIQRKSDEPQVRNEPANIAPKDYKMSPKEDQNEVNN